MQKLYAYVDETGSDMGSDTFLASVVITASERDKIIYHLNQIEKISGKKQRKWSKVAKNRRCAYMNLLFTQPLFKNKLYYNFAAKDSVHQLYFTAVTTAQAIGAYVTEPYKVTVLVDGLSKTDARKYTKWLHKERIQTEKVRGTTDEAEIFIRLADAICGFLREALIEQQPEFRSLLENASKNGYLHRVP